MTRQLHNPWNDEHPQCVRTPPQSPCGKAWGGDAQEQTEKLQAIGALAASLAHDLSNPLCGVRSVLERMSRKPLWDDAERDLLRLALVQCDHMRLVLRELQESAAPASGQWTACALEQTLEAVLLLARKQLRLYDCTVQFAKPSKKLWVWGEQRRLRHLLLHLLLTCCRDPFAGGCRLDIRAGIEGERTQMIFRVEVAPSETDRLQQRLLATLSPSNKTAQCLYAILHQHDGELNHQQRGDGTVALILSLPTLHEEVQR